MKVIIDNDSEAEDLPVDVQIDLSDLFNMDVTLAHIILPLLKMLKEHKTGAPSVDDADVPSDLWSTRSDGQVDKHWFARWEYVMDTMIEGFEITLEGGDEEKMREGHRLFGKYFHCLWM